MEHLALMEDLCHTMASASLCGLGQSAANPVLSTLKYFRDEYEAHIRDKKCPALVCRPLLKYTIDPETCTGCLACVRECPVEAIRGKAGNPRKSTRNSASNAACAMSPANSTRSRVSVMTVRNLRTS